MPWRVKFYLSKCNFALITYIVLRGRDTHIDFPLVIVLVGMICPLMQEHFLLPFLKCKALHCG